MKRKLVAVVKHTLIVLYGLAVLALMAAIGEGGHWVFLGWLWRQWAK